MEDSEAATINNIGAIFLEMKQYPKAITFFEQSMEINKRLGKDADYGFDCANIGLANYKLKKYPEALNSFNEALLMAKKVNSFSLFTFVYSSLTELYKETGNYQKALESHMEYSKYKDSVFTENTNQHLAKLQAIYETDQKEKEIQLKNAELGQKDLQNKKQRIIMYSLILGMLMFVALIYLIYRNLKRNKKQNLLLAAEKARSEELLLNIIPQKVLAELKSDGVVKPESFDNVTIFFSDIEGFTRTSAHMQPQLLIDQLNQIFTAFDEIMSKYNCDRIKTIGDAYMAVCGIPEKDPNHAEKILEAAREIRDYMNKRNETAEYKMAIRIGINSGKVVGGIVGIKKYAYDVFGDAVNTASRMEHYSESMKINIAEGTYHRLYDKYKFIEREPIEVKGKGMMKMYFLDE
jgi:class 3 adenylate cyclase